MSIFDTIIFIFLHLCSVLNFSEKGHCLMRHLSFALAVSLTLSACGGGGEYKPDVVVDTSKVDNLAKYNEDKQQCGSLASSIDLTSEAAGKALAGAATGGVAVAGIATAVSGAVFLPALPFIAAGSLLGGGALGASVSAKEKKQRNKIFGLCMRDRGYRAYIPE
ncbi:hypothetical protein N9Y15_02460 [Alphaproteobacteria bacterium]|nr:hypothetical protein [Alphaproteobacteria bacterium]MDB2575050.1 hypothetical protein [Alphaproteobacteria bacterium]